MSVFVFAGSAQFLCVELLAAGASLYQVALLTFLLNFRHFFYGLTMVSRYHNVKKSRRWYLIFGLTDETYAILSAPTVPEDIDAEDFYTAVTLLNQFYWVLGSVLGGTIGTLITFNTAGIDFAMTALFAVLVVEQWKAHSNHLPAILGFGVTIVALMVFGADNFLIPALIVISAILLLMKNKLSKEAVS